MSVLTHDSAARRGVPPLAPSRRRIDIDGIVGIACALMLPVALLLI